MKSLQAFAENPFEVGLESASTENVIQFVQDTINRFENNDQGGLYTKDNTELKNEFSIFNQGAIDREKGEQKASTATVKSMLARIYTFADNLDFRIKSVFGKNSPKLLEFFPRGKAYIRKANRGDIGNILNILITKSKKYDNDLAGNYVSDATALLVDWDGSLKTQSGEKTDVQKGSNTVHSTLAPLATILNRLYLKVRLNNEANVKAAVAIYFDETPLLTTQSSDHDGLGRSYGTVTDALTGSPIADVDIRVIDGKNKVLWTGKTDKDGKWRTANISIGLFSFHFEKAGYIAQTLAHDILDYQDTELDVKLGK